MKMFANRIMWKAMGEYQKTPPKVIWDIVAWVIAMSL
jgi:hypothetical protein